MLGLAKSHPNLFSEFANSVTSLDKILNEIKVKMTASNEVMEALKAGDTGKAVEAAMKGLKLQSVGAALKKVQEAQAKGDAKSVLAAIPKKTLMVDLSRAAATTLDDIPDLIEKSTRAAEAGVGMGDKIANSGLGAMDLALTAAEVKPLVAKVNNIKKSAEDIKTQGEKLKVNIENMQKEAEALPETETASA
jgi:hypothetical protein